MFFVAGGAAEAAPFQSKAKGKAGKGNSRSLRFVSLRFTSVGMTNK